MTSEGQHAGQPAEATSGGGGTEPTTRGSAYGTPRVGGGFSPDPDDQPPGGPSATPPAAPQTGWGPDAYPNSYGPPPYPAGGSGSPFVVPAVPVFGSTQEDAQSPVTPGARPAAATFRSSAQVPAQTGDAAVPAEQHPYRAEPHPYRVTAAAEEREPGQAAAAEPDHPYRNVADGHPYRAAGSAAGSASVPMASPFQSAPFQSGPPQSGPPQSGPPQSSAPQLSAPYPSSPDAGDGRASGRDEHDAPAGSPAADSRMLPGGPLPSRADRQPFGGPDGPGNPDSMSGFNGFVSSAPARRPAGGGDGSGDGDHDGGSRAPGISAFGGQRVRVPGAALTGLSDAPPAGQARPSDSGGFHLRGSGDAAPGDDAGFSALPQPRTPTDQPSGQPSVAQSSPGHPDAGHLDAGHPDPGHPRPDQSAQAQSAHAPAGSGQAGPVQAAAGVAVGSARPVTASASVPVASRVPVPPDVEDVPVAGGAGPRARVYGRATPNDPQDSADGQDSPAPVSPFPPRSGEDVHQYRDAGNGHGPGGTGYPPPAGRASASARVTPAAFPPADPAPYPRGNPAPYASGPLSGGPNAQVAMPYSEHTTDVSGRGRSQTPSVEPAGPATTHFPAAPFGDDPNGRAGSNGNGAAPYSEHTTDVSRRGGAPDHPYAAAMPPMAGNRPGLDGFAPTDPHRRMERPPAGGVFPDPARATVTPPDPTETTSWAPPAQGSEQSRFDSFGPEEHTGPVATPASAPAADKPEATTVRMLPVLLGVILAAALLVGMAIGIVWLIARPGDSGFDVSAGECVKRNGDKAVTATCGDPGSYEVVSKVDAKEQCADPGQPYVLNPAGDGRSQVLCLKPN